MTGVVCRGVGGHPKHERSRKACSCVTLINVLGSLRDLGDDFGAQALPEGSPN